MELIIRYLSIVFPGSNSLTVIRFLGVTADEAYGGLAMGYQAHCIILEEISRASGMGYFQSASSN